jgi:arylsulfatase A-like enzyme
VHPPEQAHPDFDQTNPARLGLYADLMAEMDYRVGQVVDCVDEAGIADNTIIVFSSDNATCHIPAFVFGGSNGPWRGDFFQPARGGVDAGTDYLAATALGGTRYATMSAAGKKNKLKMKYPMKL